MDCSEFVNRVLSADEVTDGVTALNTSGLKTMFEDEKKFKHSESPEVGDIALWDGHVGVVTEVGDNGKIKLTHARGAGKLAAE